MWSEKYRPKRMEEMVGNEEGRASLLAWLGKWKRGARAALLLGPPGTGKTTAVHLAAEKLGLNLVELNASDTRTKERLSRRMGEVVGSASLYGGRSLIFLDEIDGLAGRADYGAIDFVKDTIKASENPVVMAANDPESDEVKKLARVTHRIEFERLDREDLVKRLRAIAVKEDVKVDDSELDTIARTADGDVRSAINSLQSGLAAWKDQELTVAQAVNAFFEAPSEKDALRALRAYPGQPREKVRDLFVAVARSRVHEERKAAALEVLSRADVLVGRIVRGRDWRLLRYLDPMLASELWKALGDGGLSYTQDAVAWPIQLRIWNDARKLKDVGLIAGRRLGISQRGCLVEDVPYLLLLCRDREFRERLGKSLNLEENYMEFLTKEAARSSRR